MSRTGSVSASAGLDLDPAAAFEAMLAELATALGTLGIELDPRSGGSVREGGVEIGHITAWEPGRLIRLDWRPTTWPPEPATTIELRFEALEGGSRATIEHSGWAEVVGDGLEMAGWFASELAAPVLKAGSPAGFGDWLTNRRARRPSGPAARDVYRDPVYHRPNFKALLAALGLRAEDRLLEIGCGGGAFLEEALRSGCSAAAVDHSPEMVRLASEVNREAVAEGRLEVREGSATRLPFQDASFTCAVSTGVFGFIDQPVEALAEIRRCLAGGGRLALFAGGRELKGTPAAPEPMASRIHFYEDAELEDLARRAGFAEARVERPALGQFAREAGRPPRPLLFSMAPPPASCSTRGAEPGRRARPTRRVAPGAGSSNAACPSRGRRPRSAWCPRLSAGPSSACRRRSPRSGRR